METSLCYAFSYPISTTTHITKSPRGLTVSASRSDTKKHHTRKPQPTKNLRHRRRTEPPPDFHPILHPVPFDSDSDTLHSEYDVSDSCDENLVWESDEIETISSLFQGRVPQKPGKPNRERPLPLPLPHKIQPLRFPTPKNLIKNHPSCSSRQPVSNQIYKNPTFLITLAREIRTLNPEDNVSVVLDPWARFLRKGSLSLTVRELGHMGLPNRALHVFCWVQNQPHLFPDDRILASTVEILARAHELKMPFEMDKFIMLASKNVYEAMVKGFIKGGNSRLAWKLLSVATEGKRMLDSGVYAKLISQLGKDPDRRMLVLPLLEELAEREELVLTQQDCTSVMKVCSKMGRFEIVEALYDWFKNRSGNNIPSVVMYTTVIHSRCLESKYRDAMAVVWEMEDSNCVLDLPAYRVLIKLFVGLNDVSRAARYFSKLKESGFRPSYGIYRDMIGVYTESGRLAKCKEIRHEAEMAGFKLEM
ncbi:hypothetical protein ABFS83_13G041500 [Erythranthe nasuta]